MSKRPKTANAVMSRLRRPAGRLRDLPIWSKLGLIMLVPTLATIIVGTQGLIDHIDEASNADRARTLAVLSQAAGGLVDHLQNERAYGVMIATTKPDTPDREAAVLAYTREHPKVDAAKLPAHVREAFIAIEDRGFYHHWGISPRGIAASNSAGSLNVLRRSLRLSHHHHEAEPIYVHAY